MKCDRCGKIFDVDKRKEPYRIQKLIRGTITDEYDVVQEYEVYEDCYICDECKIEFYNFWGGGAYKSNPVGEGRVTTAKHDRYITDNGQDIFEEAENIGNILSDIGIIIK